MSHVNPSDTLSVVTTPAARSIASVSRRTRSSRPREADADDEARCTPLLDRLEAMSRTEWLAIGERALGDASDNERATEHRRAVIAVETTIAQRELGVAAWLVRDAVETLAYVASCASDGHLGRRHAAPPCTEAERATLTAARRAAELAALAHLARPWLEASDYLALLGPFRSVAHFHGFFVR